MPVAGAIKLDIVTAANDKATATLRAIQGELRKTEEQIKQINATSEDSAFLSADEKSGLDGRRRKMFLDEAAALEQSTQRRREQVLADRAARTEQLASATAAGRFKGAVEGASKVQEFFNKALGVAGFAGIIGGAVVGLAELIGEVVGYESAIDKAAERQVEFQALLAKTAEIAFGLKLERVAPQEAERLKAEKEMVDLQDKYVSLQVEREVAQKAIDEATARIAESEAVIAKEIGFTTTSQLKIASHKRNIEELNRIIAAHEAAITQAKADEAEFAAQVQRLLVTSSPLYASARDAVMGIAAGMSVAASKATELATDLATIARNATAAGRDGAATAAAKDQEERKREREERAKQAGAEARATEDRIRDMQRQMTLARALAGVESESAREQIQLELQVAQIREDVAARRIKSQAEASAMIEKAETEFRLAEEARLRAAEDGYAQAFEAALEREDERRAKVLERTEDLRRELAVLEAGTAADEARLEAARQLADLEARRGKGEVTDDEAAVQGELIARIAELKAAKEAANAETERSLELLAEYGITAEQVGRAIEGLTGTFAGLGGNLTSITALWADYERQQSKLGKSSADQAKAQKNLGNAIAGTIGQTGAAIAAGMEDRKAAAVLEGLFYSAASAAAFIGGNIPAGVGYAGVAVEFFALAGKGGGKGKGAAGGSKGGGSGPTAGTGGQSAGSSSSGPFVSVVQQFGNGIVFGMAQDIGKASGDAAYSLRGTGHDQSRGFG